MEYRTIYHSDKEAIVELLVGKSVVAVDHKENEYGTYDYKMKLSDGTVLEVEGNDGCGGCSSGHYYVTELNECENIITNVEFVDHDDYSERYQIFVYAEDRRINLLTVEGWDNGYYGYGYWFNVKVVS